MKIKSTAFVVAMSFAMAHGQNWTGYPAGSLGTPYTNGLMTATVTKVNTTMNDGTPKFTTSTSPDCYIAAGCLALNSGFFNSYIAGSSRIQVDLDFTSGGNNGTCNSAAFTIRDINSGENFTDFLDVVEISAIDGNNAAIPAGNITVTPPVQVTVVTVGNTKKIVGHNSASEVVTGGPYLSTPCNLTSINVVPPANTPLKSIRIIYRPAVGTNSSNAYYSVGTHPAVQYISISNLTMTPTGGGCVVLPEELTAFRCETRALANELSWTAATEGDVNYWIEKGSDGINYEVLGHVEGSDNLAYFLEDRTPFEETYYRLSRQDADGNRTFLATLLATNPEVQPALLTIAPNPSGGEASWTTLTHGLNNLSVHDLTGKQVWSGEIEGIGTVVVNAAQLPEGIYMVTTRNAGRSSHQKWMVNH